MCCSATNVIILAPSTSSIRVLSTETIATYMSLLMIGNYLLSTGYSDTALMEKLGPVAVQEINRLEDEYLDTILVTRTTRRRLNM